MYYLKLTNEHNQIQVWWFNFCYNLTASTINNDINTALKKWGARVDYNSHGYSDTVAFESEEAMAWFLLRWS